MKALKYATFIYLYDNSNARSREHTSHSQLRMHAAFFALVKQVEQISFRQLFQDKSHKNSQEAKCDEYGYFSVVKSKRVIISIYHWLQ